MWYAPLIFQLISFKLYLRDWSIWLGTVVIYSFSLCWIHCIHDIIYLCILLIIDIYIGLAIRDSIAMKFLYIVLNEHMNTFCLVILQTSRVGASDVMYVFNFNKYYQNIFRDGCNSLYSHQWCLRVLGVLIVMRLCKLPSSLCVCWTYWLASNL